MGGRGIALATDMGVVAAGARFSPPAALPKNCPASYANSIGSFDIVDIATAVAGPLAEILRGTSAALRDQEEAGYRQQYNRAGQTNPVRYHRPDGRTHPASSLVDHTTPTGRVYDFNTEGMKTYGALPDLLQDAVNAGVDPADLAPLMHSAQDYVDMWRKAYRVTGCTGLFTDAAYRRCAGAANPVDPGIGPCANTCPDSPGRGHLILPDGSRLFPGR
jgi:hypothetical protein